MTPKCRYDADLGWLTVEHVRDCKGVDCAGCKPCGKSHCDFRGHCGNHVEQHAGIYTCPACIGHVRRKLRRVVEMHTYDMRREALAAGVDSEAFNLLGPAASADQTLARRDYQDADRGWCDFPPPNDPHHPYAILGRWDLAMRESYGPATDLFITVTRAADYLEGLMNAERSDFAHTRQFQEFSRDLNKCLRHLEDVAHDSREPEKGAPCPSCEKPAPRLHKHYGHAVDGSGDKWQCPRVPEHHWEDAEYRARVDGDYLKHATELPARELAERIGVALSTFRKWTAKTWNDDARAYDEARLKHCGKGADGRKLYRVADAQKLAEREAA